MSLAINTATDARSLFSERHYHQKQGKRNAETWCISPVICNCTCQAHNTLMEEIEFSTRLPGSCSLPTCHLAELFFCFCLFVFWVFSEKCLLLMMEETDSSSVPHFHTPMFKIRPSLWCATDKILIFFCCKYVGKELFFLPISNSKIVQKFACRRIFFYCVYVQELNFHTLFPFSLSCRLRDVPVFPTSRPKSTEITNENRGPPQNWQKKKKKKKTPPDTQKIIRQKTQPLRLTLVKSKPNHLPDKPFVPRKLIEFSLRSHLWH